MSELLETVEIEPTGTARASVVWDTPWGPEKMSEAARLQLGLF